MSKAYSLSDLKLLEQFKNFNEIDFLKLENTELLKPVLNEIGIDINVPITFLASHHRNLQGKVVVGYQIVGEIRRDKDFLMSPWCSAEDRLAIACYKDVSLAQELANSMSVCLDYSNKDADIIPLPSDQLNDDSDEITSQIVALQSIVDVIRGNPYKTNGGRKTLDEQCESDVVKEKKTIKKKNS